MNIAIVIDTCVFISALRSRNGASFKLLSLIDESKFEFNLSVSLVLEYEAVAKRMSRSIGLTHQDIDDVIDYLCAVGKHRQVHFLWRPNLKDPGDDFVLELAVESECKYIVTHNVRDFSGSEKFKVKAITPQSFLRVIGAIS
ncbi:MAG: putative toxin-antitoxin system toxin component, PIN family [Deltaproteobacteria bacterium]|nr:putative toxin-antitoxin system toxin component, PIN family [Deltaproteobacteria bacterium]